MAGTGHSGAGFSRSVVKTDARQPATARVVGCASVDNDELGGTMTDQTIASFQQRLRGRLIQPSDADYDAARALYNGMIDKRPRLIAAIDAADVITAVNFARDEGLLLAIRGGGHNGPGLGGCGHGLADLPTSDSQFIRRSSLFRADVPDAIPALSTAIRN